MESDALTDLASLCKHGKQKQVDDDNDDERGVA